MSPSLAFYDPFTELDKLFDDAFNARLRPATNGEGNSLTAAARRDRAFPRMDLYENPETKTMTATFELPGLKSEDINVEIHGNRLTVSGESKRSENYDKAGYVVQERSYGKFSRSLPIPQGIKAEDLQAKLENGVLAVCFPKAAPDQQPKRIAIARTGDLI